jgi:inner membrane protein involved in colicin E2 resistance
MAKKIKEQFDQVEEGEFLFDVDLSGTTELEFVPEGEEEGFTFEFDFEDEE